MKRNGQEGTCAANDTQRREISLRTGVRNVQRAVVAHPTKPWFINTDLFALNGYRYRTEMRFRNEIVALTKSQSQVIDAADPRSTLYDGIKHRLHIRGGPADDAEYLGRCSLMLQRLAQFSVAFLYLLEQAYILDCDHCLGSEGFQQRDVFF